MLEIKLLFLKGISPVSSLGQTLMTRPPRDADKYKTNEFPQLNKGCDT